MMREMGADVEATEICFHVPATSLEALSAIRRRCRDMEALFSSFHVGDVGVGVVGGYSGRRFGRLVMSWTCGASDVGVVLPELRNKKKPCKSIFTGRGRRRGCGRGLVQPLVRQLGCFVDVEGGVVSLCCQSTREFKKDPVNVSLQDLLLFKSPQMFV